MSIDVDLWLAYQDIDLEKLCDFLARDPSKYISKNQTTLIINNIEVYLSQRKDSTYQQMTKYDKHHYWVTYVIIDCQQRYYTPMIFLIGLTIAKYVSVELKGATFFTDNDGYSRFFYGQEGLVLSYDFLNHYYFPASSSHRFEDAAFSQYGKLKNISHVFNESSDIVVHVFDDFIDNKWLNYFCNNDHPQKDTLPKPNQYIRYALPVATSLLTIQKNAWQYGSYFQNEYPIALHYRIPDTWRDVMILQILLDCSSGAFYTYGIEDISYNTKQLIVSTGDGEIIFLFKQNEFVINSKWQEYFSKFPIGVNTYCIDDSL